MNISLTMIVVENDDNTDFVFYILKKCWNIRNRAYTIGVSPYCEYVDDDAEQVSIFMIMITVMKLIAMMAIVAKEIAMMASNVKYFHDRYSTTSLQSGLPKIASALFALNSLTQGRLCSTKLFTF